MHWNDQPSQHQACDLDTTTERSGGQQGDARIRGDSRVRWSVLELLDEFIGTADLVFLNAAWYYSQPVPEDVFPIGLRRWAPDCSLALSAALSASASAKALSKAGSKASR